MTTGAVSPSARRALLVNVADVRRRNGSRKPVAGVVPLEGISVGDARISEGAEATVAVELESVPEGGLVATGTVRAPWVGTCRRCLARELLALELPMAPLCRDDCAGLCPACGADRNTVDCGHDTTPTDPRWGALTELREQLAVDRDPTDR